MADRKRKLLAGASAAPPAKRMKIQESASGPFQEESKEAVVAYQKEKMLLRINELNREVERYLQKERDLETKKEELDVLVEVVSRNWSQLQSSLVAIAGQFPSLPKDDCDAMDTSNDVDYDEENVPLHTSLIEAVRSSILGDIKQLKKSKQPDARRIELQRKFEVKAEASQNILKRVLLAIAAQEKLMAENDAAVQQKSLSAKVAQVQNDAKALQLAFAKITTKASEAESKVSTLEEELSAAIVERDEHEASVAILERKVDKLEKAVNAAGASSAGVVATTAAPKHSAKVPFKKAAAAAATAQEKSNSQQGQNEEELKELQQQVAEQKLVLDKRSKEITDLQDERQRLMQEATELRHSAVVTEERIRGSHVHQDAVERMKRLTGDLAMATTELKEVKAGLFQAKEFAKDELEKVQLMHREELKRLQQEMDNVQESLSRMTEERNSISHNMSVLKSSKASKKTAVELNKLVDSQASEIKRLKKELSVLRLETKREGSEAEDELMAEIDEIGEELVKMQAQNKRITKQLSGKDDANAQLMSQSIQGKMKEGLLKKEAQLEQQRANVLKEKVDGLENLIGKKDAKSKALSDQISNLKSEVKLKTEAGDKLDQELQKTQSSLDEVKAKLAQLQTAQNEIADGTSKQLAAYDKDARRMKRLEEDNALLKKKLERYAKSKSEEYLEEALQNYKHMLNCPICKERRKTTVIAKCFHVFCRECIQHNLDLRKRRCPACQNPFSADDVKEIWLNFTG